MTPVTDAATFAEAARATEQQIADLKRFRGLLAEWNERFNLVGPSALEQFWPRHAWDSAQLCGLAPEASTWADLGAGAGFPGLVLAIMLKGREGAHVHLVESMEKRCRFLQAVADELDLPVTVHRQRAEDGAVPVDIVTARACAPMTRLLGYARLWMTAGAKGLFLKGSGAETEILEARKDWAFTAEVQPSLSDPSGRIVSIERAPKATRPDRQRERARDRARERHVRRA